MAEDGLVQILARLHLRFGIVQMSIESTHLHLHCRHSLCWTLTVGVWPSSTIRTRERT